MHICYVCVYTYIHVSFSWLMSRYVKHTHLAYATYLDTYSWLHALPPEYVCLSSARLSVFSTSVYLQYVCIHQILFSHMHIQVQTSIHKYTYSQLSELPSESVSLDDILLLLPVQMRHLIFMQTVAFTQQVLQLGKL
jgi:hypothetical protein